MDYVGLGNEIKKALHDAQPDADPAEQTPADVDEFAEQFTQALGDALSPRFDGIDRSTAGWDSLIQAQQRLKDAEARDDFAADMVRMTTLFEFLDPSFSPIEATTAGWHRSTTPSSPPRPPTRCCGAGSVPRPSA